MDPKDKKMIKELVVVSGKGGTGKTSIVASFAALAQKKVLADCDVDAADLHLILKPNVHHREVFRAGREAVIKPNECAGCGKCLSLCRFKAIREEQAGQGKKIFSIDPISCEGCGVCVHFCPQGAIDFPEKTCGEWFLSDTRCGPMVHAKLGIAEENSGKLVTLVRSQAKKIAEQKGLDLIIIDGSPGIGCPVIASIGGASLVLVVTEPTLSGEHDLQRVVALTNHFKIPVAICINKFDLNITVTEKIEREAKEKNIIIAGRIHYDKEVTLAQVEAKAVVECNDSPAGKDIQTLWKNVKNLL